MNQLQTFAAHALRQLPASLWWVLVLLISAFFSIKLEKELFPNTPAAATVAQWVAIGCLLALVPLGIGWLWRVAARVEHSGWRLLWYLAAIGATGMGLVLGLLLLVGALILICG